MKLFLISAAAFALAIIGMAIGVIISNRRLRGSCGGLAGREDESGRTVCDLCTAPTRECTGEPRQTETHASNA